MYQSWSVVFGEQPSAAKWNILGSNDAFFSGLIGSSGGLMQLKSVPFQSNTTNNTYTDLAIQAGFGVIQGNNTNNVEETVSLPVAFSTILGVMPCSLGVKTSAATLITELDTGQNNSVVVANAYNITTSSFTLRLTSDNGQTLSNSVYFGYSWIAFGRKS